MIFKRLWLTIILFLISFPLIAQTETIKIGLIDADRIIKESIEMQKLYKDLQALVDKKQDELKRKQDEIAQLEDKYKTQASVLSATAQAQLEEKIRKGYVDLTKFREDSKIEIQTKETAALTEMEKKVGPIIAEVGRAENYTLVLRKEAVVYLTAGIDITDKVIKKLNESVATKPVASPAPKK